MSQTLPDAFLKAVLEIIPENRVYADDLRRYAHGTDASFYRLTPKLVIQVNDEAEIAKLLKLCSIRKIPVTFRGAGTSLSGQAVTDSVLFILSPNWRKVRVLDGGKKISMQSGVIGAHANALLHPYGFKIGPDPASIQSATIGGIVANNASGMCCGVKFNSYHTLQSIRMILHDGTLLDTSDANSVSDFKSSQSELLRGLSLVAEKVKNDADLKKLIARKYGIKNTMGYCLNAFLDGSDQVDILQRLMVGSEGTLGFISEVTLKTITVQPVRAAGLFIFQNADDCIAAASRLSGLPAIQALEFMDDKCLISVARKYPLGISIAAEVKGSAGLLIEIAGKTNEEVSASLESVERAAREFQISASIPFSFDSREIDRLWGIRKGLFPTVGAMRELGTTVIIEDVCVPMKFLSEAVNKIKALFESLNYQDAVLFGHIRDGNLHIVFSQKFSDSGEVGRYKQLMASLASMITDEFNGSLKAEHGTGRNMAPFVEKEWGPAAYSIMWEIKKLFDPNDVLNPGVLLNRDFEVHLKNLKNYELTDPSIDACVECGFCEPVCPSKDLSLTPRQRIAVSREMARMEKEEKNSVRLRSFKRSFDYLAEKTCAADGLCGTVCPVDIDTGAYIKNYRSSRQSPGSKRVARLFADHFSLLTRMVGAGLYFAHSAAKLFGESFIEKISFSIHKVSGERVPVWYAQCPIPGESIGQLMQSQGTESSSNQTIGYFPSCIARTMGQARNMPNQISLPRAVLETLRLLEIQPVIPQKNDQLCCGLVFASKGFPHLAEEMRGKVFREMSACGTKKILSDVSPCTQWLKEGSRSAGFTVLDPVEIIHESLKEWGGQIQPQESAYIHNACSIKKMNLEDELKDVAKKLVRQPVFPYTGCCGFSGDKGLFTPELSRSALSQVPIDLTGKLADGYTTSPSCGIAVGRAAKANFQSLFHLFLKCCGKKQF